MVESASVFGVDRALVGVVHVGALPGCPRQADEFPQVVAQAVGEAKLLEDSGFDALILENMHDVPYLRRDVGPEITACMTALVAAVRAATSCPLGVQVLAGANRAALAVALAGGASFIRAEGFVFASVADEGLLEEADAGPLLRYRRQVGGESIRILADIKKKHSSHAITEDVGLAETGRAAEFFGADGLVISGTATGQPTSVADLRAVAEAVEIPVVVGSGATPDTLSDLYTVANAVIVGSWYKEEGVWSNPPEPARARELGSLAQRLRR